MRISPTAALVAVAAALGAASVAQAEMPVFSASCPLGNNLDADANGTVRVNGSVAQVQEFNPNYYEASADGVTYSISHDGGGSGLIVSYTGPDRANGICTILAQAGGENTATADDGGGALAGAGGEQRVSFPAGSTGTELAGSLAPGQSMRYVLGASEGQFLYTRVAHRDGPRTDFQIFNPDGSFLLEMIPTDKEYRGQLWQSGDHVIEVINRGGATAEYNVIFGIE